MIKNWIKIFLYHAKNNAFFTALNILGLSLGIAGLIFAVLYWNDEYSYNSWNPGKDNTFYLVSDLGEGMVWGASAAPLGPKISEELPDVQEYCYMNSWYNSDMISYNGKKIIVDKITDAQKNFFNFFPFEFIKGSPSTALDVTSVSLSETTAQRLFGSADALNNQVLYNDKMFTVKGVYKITGKSSYMPDMVINTIDWKLKDEAANWGNFRFSLCIKLKNPDQAALIKEKIDGLYYEYNTKKNAVEGGISPEEYIKRFGQTKVTLEPLKDVRLHSIVNDIPEGRGNYQFLVIMAGLSVLILLMSVANYVNLATANAIKRAKEVGVRKIMGASKGNIIKQFVFETVLTTLLAILLALVIVEISLPYYNTFLSKNLTINGSEFFMQLILLFVVVVVISGVLPAIYVSKFQSVQVLKGNFGRSKKGVWLRNAMLIGQFAIASFFITGSYIVNTQINYMSNKELGFNASQVVDIYYRNPYDFKVEGFKKLISQKYSRVKEQLLRIKGVEQVAAGTFKIGGGSSFQSGYNYNGIEISLHNMAVDYNLLEMMDIKIIEGHGLSDKISSDTINSVLLNETAVKMFQENEPIGKIINWGGGGGDVKLKIVGVVKDFHVNGLQEKIPPMAFYHYKTIDWMLQNSHDIYVKINPRYMETTMAEIEKIWTNDVDPDFPFSYSFVNKNFERTYKSFVYQRNLFMLLNIVVVVIALFGLFALASYSIQRRMKEIAIRKTLGAETKVLLKELSKQYVLFCLAGFIMAILPAWMLLEKWLENFAYRINISALPFLAGFVALMVLTLVVVLSRAYMATQVNVLKYLKYE